MAVRLTFVLLAAVTILGVAVMGMHTTWLPTDDHNAAGDWRFWVAIACFVWAGSALLLLRRPGR